MCADHDLAAVAEGAIHSESKLVLSNYMAVNVHPRHNSNIIKLNFCIKY